MVCLEICVVFSEIIFERGSKFPQLGQLARLVWVPAVAFPLPRALCENCEVMRMIPKARTGSLDQVESAPETPRQCL